MASNPSFRLNGAFGRICVKKCWPPKVDLNHVSWPACSPGLSAADVVAAVPSPPA